MTVLRIFLSCCVLLASSPLWAGGGRDGVSQAPGVFFVDAAQDEVTSFTFEPPQHAIALREHCQRGGGVFSHVSRARYRCKVTDSSGQGDGSGYQHIEVPGAIADLQARDLSYALFTTQPVRKTEWKVRPLSADELAGITTFIDASKQRYGYLSRYVAADKAFAVDKTEGRQTAYFVPGPWVRDVEGGYEAQRHHVFVGKQGTYRYQGQLPDKPARYYDLDGGALPAIETNESCDGWCITLWDIRRGPRMIANYGGH
jgi:hypothetical protein